MLFPFIFYPTTPTASEVDQMVWTLSILELQKSTTLTYINQYRCVGRKNPQLNCTWDFSKRKENKTGLFSPSTFTVLLTLETGLAAFPSHFQAEMHIPALYTSCGRFRRCMRCRHEPGMLWMWQQPLSAACSPDPPWARQARGPAGSARCPPGRLHAGC